MRLAVDAVKVVEVGPRDGLQNEKVTIPTEAKVEYITALADAGLRVIEAGAFVSPKWVPQMADTAAVFRDIPKDPGVEYPVLVPNMKGLERAIDAGVKSIAIFTAASDTFNKRNINMTIDESFANYAPVVARAFEERMRVRGGQGKWLLKKAMRRYLPDDILYRPKQGFVTPIAEWLRGPLAGATQTIAASAALAAIACASPASGPRSHSAIGVTKPCLGR